MWLINCVLITIVRFPECHQIQEAKIYYFICNLQFPVYIDWPQKRGALTEFINQQLTDKQMKRINAVGELYYQSLLSNRNHKDVFVMWMIADNKYVRWASSITHLIH